MTSKIKALEELLNNAPKDITNKELSRYLLENGVDIVIKPTKCDCYCVEKKIVVVFDKITIVDVGRCNGTRERDECSCGGDKNKCDFY